MFYFLILHILVLFPLSSFLSILWWKTELGKVTLGNLIMSLVWGLIPVFGICVAIGVWIERFLSKKVDWNMEIWK